MRDPNNNEPDGRKRAIDNIGTRAAKVRSIRSPDFENSKPPFGLHDGNVRLRGSSGHGNSVAERQI